ncbi:DUF3105 domain-containing protein [Streptomyces albipurpureus]|uniref:DUF3105 domain-containing protein n=1 Tax=Streptomyces albipurpureus TaxID=2897419 RepID=A0ABT0UR54_9ACTN|nr:DUF3105 domain-containing protein [Streptomyces sp. CWNU-1]MCM2391023.1 DUF3105 domain-containing protein [Streptomyces sp. CWNU-1]
MASRKTSDDRRARIEAMRKAEQSRERRNRVLTIGISGVVVASLIGFGVYVMNKESEEQEQKVAEAKAPIANEQTWDAKKLGRNHVDKAVQYPMKPPVGGDHHHAWMNCNGDVYKESIPNENAVHSLEHGAVWVTYNDKAAKADVEKLEKRVKGNQYTLMSPVKDQAGAIMLSAWGKQITAETASDPRVDRFLAKYVLGEQTPEKGAACTGGLKGK